MHDVYSNIFTGIGCLKGMLKMMQSNMNTAQACSICTTMTIQKGTGEAARPTYISSTRGT